MMKVYKAVHEREKRVKHPSTESFVRGFRNRSMKQE